MEHLRIHEDYEHTVHTGETLRKVAIIPLMLAHLGPNAQHCAKHAVNLILRDCRTKACGASAYSRRREVQS